MAITVLLSGHLKSFSGGASEIELADDPRDVGSALDSLWKLHPALRDRILNEQGEIRRHVNIFLGTEDVKRLGGLETALTSNEIYIFNAVSGG
jgi:molybdopterin synthase sulfur carrier subunit